MKSFIKGFAGFMAGYGVLVLALMVSEEFTGLSKKIDELKGEDKEVAK